MLNFFNKIIDTLNELEIEYMLSGSIAMGLYVVPRATRDFDFIIHLNQSKVDSFVEKFKEGYYCDKDSIKDAIRSESMFNVIDNESGYKADFVILKNQDYRLQEFGRKLKMNCWGKEVYIVSPEDLLLSKLYWIQDYQSQIQIEDIKLLSKIETLDWTYIKLWIYHLKLKSFNIL